MKKINVGDFVTFSTHAEGNVVSGRVVKIVRYNGYTTVHVDSDGMIYHFGTGGQLGDTWTCGNGSEQWFRIR